MKEYFDERPAEPEAGAERGDRVVDKAAASAVSWVTPREAVHVVFLRTTLRRTIKIALAVGTILSLINQGGIIAGGDVTGVTWLRIAANYLVPFCVSSAGYLTATKRSQH